MSTKVKTRTSRASGRGTSTQRRPGRGAARGDPLAYKYRNDVDTELQPQWGLGCPRIGIPLHQVVVTPTQEQGDAWTKRAAAPHTRAHGARAWPRATDSTVRPECRSRVAHSGMRALWGEMLRRLLHLAPSPARSLNFLDAGPRRTGCTRPLRRWRLQALEQGPHGLLQLQRLLLRRARPVAGARGTCRERHATRTRPPARIVSPRAGSEEAAQGGLEVLASDGRVVGTHGAYGGLIDEVG